MRSREVNREALMNPTESDIKAAPSGLSGTDMAFMGLMGVLLIFVAWLTTINYQEGMKTEAAKRNGEAWVEWLTETGTQRFSADFTPAACAGGAAPNSTWGPCFAHIQSKTDLGNLVNTFFNKPPHFIAQCDKGNRSTTGAIVLENLVATPAGSAIPFVVKPLEETDSIVGKVQIRVTVCDKGGYPIKIAELEF